ncbi:hypothetical protein NP233_g5480 [Leucocoprinus birnbaumii]|uniref:Uncharacterized protein n=1 Tax=Leucocoprinus birnbaumii TaxID=56174 RepID=A0AAD5VST0_9AGAR|nr:hypothetical protein NP233_g5480 [Leucocoprinus birnbaumii]
MVLQQPHSPSPSPLPPHHLSSVMKAREYCCCAIPLVNAGIYATLVEQLILGILVGALSVGTPSIVGAATPSFAGWILAIICFIGAGVQILGFIGVSKEKPILYRRYVTLHGIVLCVALAIGAVWAIISATRHSTATSNCLQRFFSDDSLQSQGQTLCNIFSWVDVGIMGGLWVLLAILQGYLFLVISSYGSAQRRDHQQYDGLSDPTHPLTKDTIPMADRSDPWDSRASDEFNRVPPANGAQYQHLRQISTASASDILNEPQQKPDDSLSSDYGYKSSYYPGPQANTYSSQHPQSSYPSDGYYTGSSHQKRSENPGGLI